MTKKVYTYVFVIQLETKRSAYVSMFNWNCDYLYGELKVKFVFDVTISNGFFSICLWKEVRSVVL